MLYGLPRVFRYPLLYLFPHNHCLRHTFMLLVKFVDYVSLLIYTFMLGGLEFGKVVGIDTKCGDRFGL